MEGAGRMRLRSEDSGYRALYVYFFISYIARSFPALAPKLYAEKGMAEGLIGVMTSVPSLVAMAFMPLLGSLADRAPRKRTVLLFEHLLMAAACFLFGAMRTFPGMLAAATLCVIFSNASMPNAVSIALEHCGQVRKPYGPVRMIGTVGYQAGLLLSAVLLARNLDGLYPCMGAAALLAGAAACLMPAVKGHQHGRQNVRLTQLFSDSHLRWLYGIILFGTVSTQFYSSFFAKYLGDMGMSNSRISIITFLSVLLEVPFLWFGDRIKRLTNVWNWLLIGLLLNGVRWLGLALFRQTLPIVLIQTLAVTTLALFEFIPAFYLRSRVRPELLGRAQSMLTFISFGAGNVIGGMLGGLVAEKTGIAPVFAFNGAMLLLGAAALYRPTRRLIREDEENLT